MQNAPNVANYVDAQNKVNALPAGAVKTAEQAKLNNIIVPVAAADFNAAITNGIKNVKLTGDVSSATQVKPAAGVTIDGNNKALEFTNTGSGEATAEGLFIAEEGITIKNLVIENPAHGDNGIEIYKNATLENVTVKGAKKAGIYVNNNGLDTVTVNFSNITTADNGPSWKAGIGLASQKADSKVIANFSGTNNFGEASVLNGTAVYSDNAAEATNDKSGLPFAGTKYTGTYQGTVTVTGLGDAFIGAYDKDNWVK